MTAVLAAVTGLLLGHALDLAFERLYTDQPLRGPLRRCPHCGRAPRALDLVPLVPTALSLGRCPDCRRALPLRTYFLAPGAAALFAIAALVFDDLGPALLAGFFATIFLALTFTDIERRLLPNRVVYPAVLLAAAVTWAWPDFSVGEAFAGGAVGLLIAGVMYVVGRGSLGFGDVKLSLLAGLVTGVPAIIVAMAVAIIAAGTYVLPLFLLGVLGRRDYIAYGPFIAIGAVVALFWGEPLWEAYRDL